MPDIEKEWKTIDLFFNPGCGAVVQYAVSDTFEPQSLRWKTSVMLCQVPSDTGSRLVHEVMCYSFRSLTTPQIVV